MISSTSSANSSPIPNGWRLAKLGDVADIVGGSTPSRAVSGFWGGEIPWVVPSELTRLTGHYLKATNESVTQDGMEAAGLRLIPAKSVLLTSRATIGATAINSIPVVTNQGFQNLIPRGHATSMWLYYAVSALHGELERRAAGSTFKEVSRNSVRSLPILLPPLEEQRGIAAVLDSIDEAIEREEAIVVATERLRDAMLHELLTRGIPDRHTEWQNVPGLGTIPACWEVGRLGEVAEVVGGSTPSRSEPEFWGGDIPWVVPSELTNLPDRFLRKTADHITDRGFQEAGLRVLPAGSILMTSRATIGVTAITQIPLTTNQGFQNFVVNDDTSGLWLYFLVSSLRHEMERRAAGSTFLEVSRDSVRSCTVPLPPLPEQEQIADVLDGIEASLTQGRTQTDMLRSLKASAAEALLTGRVRVAGEVGTT